MSLTSEQLARIAAIANEAATPQPAPPAPTVEPARVLPQSPATASPPSPPAPVGPSLDAIRDVVRAELAGSAPFGLLPNPPGTPPVTGGVAAGGSAPDALRDPYALSSDDVDALINRHGWHGAGQKIMDAIRQAPRRRLLVRKR